MISFGKRRQVGAVLLWAGIAVSSGAAAQERQLAFFGGLHTSNNWEDVFRPADLEWRDTALAGVAYGRDWPVSSRVTVGFEAQAMKHAGEQDHFEFNLPAVVRYHPPRGIPIRSLGFGLGVSHATDVPEVEVLRKGSSARTLIYWTTEVEFGRKNGALSLFTRLHHRSKAFGLLAEEGGSNVIVLGVRRRW